MSKQIISNENIEELPPQENTIEFQLYDFMNDPHFKELTTAIEYVDYFMTVKQDVLNHLDAVNCAIINSKLNINKTESFELLNCDFKAMYGKDNESIRKAHLQKVNEELYEQLEAYKFQKSVYMNQINILNDMIKSNQLLIQEPTCECKHGDD